MRNFILIMALLALMLSVQASDTTITYQGQLQDESGPVTGTPAMIFRLYNDLDSGDQVGNDIVKDAVPVSDGVFQVDLDFGEVYDQALWLDVEVDGVVLSPRQPIRPVPLAMSVLNVPDDTLAQLQCSNNQIARWNGSQWGCSSDQDTTYSAGAGLDLAGTSFELDVAFSDSRYWRRSGNTGTASGEFLGTTDDAPLELRVFGQRALVIDPSEDANLGPGMAGGHQANEITDDVAAATISGGGRSDQPNIVSGDYGVISGGYGNSVLGLYGVVGGGGGNTAGRVIDEFLDWEYATVAGGQNNHAGGRYATVGGGENNEVSNTWATVGGGRNNLSSRRDAVIGGGRDNEVDGRTSTIGGGGRNFIDGRGSVIGGGEDNEILGFSTDAATISGGEGNMVDSDYATVGGGRDNQATGLYATVVGGRENIASGRYSFAAGRNASATHTGSVVFGNGSFNDPISSEGSNEFRSQMPMYAPSFNTTSSRTAKHEVEPVDAGWVLERLLSLDIHTWEFLSEDDNGLHMGPMAQDFHATFGLGQDDTTIASVDSVGVALAAIQGLHAELVEERERNDHLEARLAEVEAESERLSSLTERNAALEERLLALEDLLSGEQEVAQR